MPKVKRGSIESKRRSFVRAHLRNASTKWNPRNKAKAKAKVDAALYACENDYCTNAMYEGISDKNLKALRKKYPHYNIIKGKPRLDHIQPVVSVDDGFVDFNTYIDRLLCDESGFACLCPDCHDKKTKEENERR